MPASRPVPGGSPLWTPDELREAAAGEWIRPPGPEWAPRSVRMPIPDVWNELHPDWLGGAIMLIVTPYVLRKYFGSEPEPKTPPAGCVVSSVRQ